jgi:hypothetical protein
VATGICEERLTPAVAVRTPAVESTHVPGVAANTDITPKCKAEVSVMVSGAIITAPAAVFSVCAMTLVVKPAIKKIATNNKANFFILYII